MIDLHLHVLPGIDDGATSFDEAREMCRLAADDGVETLITTPHQRTLQWDNRQPERLADLRRRLQEEVGERPLLLPGAEIRVDSELLAELDGADASGLLPLAGSHYLLLELDRRDPFADAAGVAHEVRMAGWVPVFAHPELIPLLIDDLPLMHRLAELGALFQVTAMSVTGEFGRRIRDRTAALLDEGLVHFVASDAHDTEVRRPLLSRARRAVARGWGEEAAERLTHTHQQAVLADLPLPLAVPVEAR